MSPGKKEIRDVVGERHGIGRHAVGRQLWILSHECQPVACVMHALNMLLPDPQKSLDHGTICMQHCYHQHEHRAEGGGRQEEDESLR